MTVNVKVFHTAAIKGGCLTVVRTSQGHVVRS